MRVPGQWPRMRAWPIALTVVLAACGGPRATHFPPATPKTPATASDARAPQQTAPVVDPLAPLPPGAVARCGTARLRFLSKPMSASIDNRGRILSIEDVDGQRVLRDVVKGTVVRTLPDSAVTQLTPDGTRLVSIRPGQHQGQLVLVVSPASGKESGRVGLELPPEPEQRAPGVVDRLQITADSRRALVIAGTTLFAVALDTPRIEWKKTLQGDSIEALSGDGTRALVLTRFRKENRGMLGVLAATNRKGVLSLVDAQSGRTLRALGTPKAPFEYSDAALSHDGTRAFIGKVDGLDVMDEKTGTLRPFVHIVAHGLGGLSVGRGRLLVSPDDSRLTYQQHGVFLIDAKSGRLHKLPEKASPLAFSPDGRLLLYRVVSAARVQGKHYRVPAGHRGPVTTLAFTDGGRRLVSAAGSVRTWDLRTGAPLGARDLDGVDVRVAASPRGGTAIAAGDLVLARGGRTLRIGAPDRLSRIAFAPDGELFVGTLNEFSAFRSHAAGVRLQPGRTLFRLSPEGRTLASANVGDVVGLAVAPHGKRIAVYARSFAFNRQRGSVELRDAATLDRLEPLPGLERYNTALAFAGAGRLIASSSAEGAALYELASHSITRRFALGHCCGALAVSPDGKLLALGADADVQLWDIDQRELRGVFRGHSGDVDALAFSPDGKLLASGSRDTSVLVWDTGRAPPPPHPPAPAIDEPAVPSLAALARGRRGERIAMLSHGKLAAPGEKLPRLPAGLLAVSRGPAASCVITAARKVMCWGGTLGSKSTALRLVPGVSNAHRIAVGLAYACAIDGAGRLSCWGSLGGAVSDQAPATLALPGKVRDIQIGLAHACALIDSGHVLCWGDNNAGQLGIGIAPYARTPTEVVGISDAVAIAVGQQHSCALGHAGSVLCWGDNGSDQLGDGTGVASRAPVRVRGLRPASSIAAEQSATCAVVDARVMCWGRLAGFRRSEVHFVEPTAVDALGKASTVRLVADHVCSEDGAAVRCARFRRRL